jgi:hypothetical protein
MAINTAYAALNAAGNNNALREDALRTLIGLFITEPEDRTSDIGRRIFEHLAQEDLLSANNFAQVSRGTYERSKRAWYTIKVLNQIVLHHIQRGVTFKAYMKEEGWKDAILVGTEVAGLATTVAASVKAGIHASRIPLDAPTSTTIVDYGEGPYEITVIDHPEAKKAAAYTTLAITAGMATVGVVCFGILKSLGNVSLGEFFSKIEKEIIGPETSTARKFFTPNYHAWRLVKMKENLASNPTNWEEDDELSEMVCPISEDLIQYPVVDRCGCTLDYRSVRVHQLTAATPMDCPVTNRINGLVRLRFDKDKFDHIQELIRNLANP